jgi:adenosine deaminase
MTEINRELVLRLPKTDLHVHLDGSLRASTLLELAEMQKIDLPANTVEDIIPYVQPGVDCKSLEEYLQAFNYTCAVLQDEDALYRVAFELGEDAALENVKYIEVRYSPILHTRKGLPFPRIVEAVAEGLREAKRKYGIMSGQIICGMRNIDPKTTVRLAELALAFKQKGVVAFDLAGAEYNNPAREHADAFYLIRKNNINCTIHAGEAYGPDSIQQALHVCGAHRIGHGTHLKANGGLLNYINDHRIPLEICISSNVQTKACDSLDTHPVRFYYDYGLRIAICTDNRLVTGTSVTDELMLLVDRFNFTLDDLRTVTLHGYKAAFLPFRKKRSVLAKALAEWDKIIDDLNHSDEEGKKTEDRAEKAAREATA